MIRILSVAVPVRVLTLVVTETAILFGCYFLAAWLDPDIPEMAAFVQFDAGLQRIAILVLTILLGMYLRNLYSLVRTPGQAALAQELLIVLGAAFMGQGLLHYLSADLPIPRKVMLFGSPMALVAISSWRLFFDAAARDAGAAQRILFIGLSPAAIETAAWLRSRPEVGIRPVGYLSNQRLIEKEEEAAQSGLLRLGNLSDLDAVLEAQQPGSLVIADRSEILSTSTEAFLELDFGGVRVEDATALYERIFGRVNVSRSLLPRLIFSDAFEPDFTTSRLQSLYSPVTGAILLVALSPLMLLLSAWLRLTSSGPSLVADWRLGLDAVPFRRWRFGTDGAIGEASIRHLGLDALPQLWNVVRGDMSLVGPAPDRAEYAKELARTIPFYSQRYRVKPGLTGWEQVHRYQRPPSDVLRRLEYDLYYIKNLAPSLDSVVLMLALKTRLL
jgi:lipopolysaccharide/colanic/teichoic acid biosynthesis glycosyltransferase